MGIAYLGFLEDRYFEFAFGEDGSEGESFETTFLLKTRINLEDIGVSEFLSVATEVELFTMIEFIFDHAARPERGRGYGTGYDMVRGKRDWQQKVNRYLAMLGEGFELSEDGEVHRLPPTGFEPLLEASTPEAAGDTRARKVEDAIRIFQRGRSTRGDRKRAIKELADVLESYKEHEAMKKLSNDASDLFHIVNKFTFRHLDSQQKDDYGDEFIDWIFYTCLNTVMLLMKLAHGDAAASADSL